MCVFVLLGDFHLSVSISSHLQVFREQSVNRLNVDAVQELSGFKQHGEHSRESWPEEIYGFQDSHQQGD